MLGVIQGPVSATTEYSILLIVTSVSPSLLKNTLFWTFPAPRVVLNDTVIGVMLKRAAAEFDVPVNVTGVLDEDPAAWLDVEIRTSLESGPTCLGMN